MTRVIYGGCAGYFFQLLLCEASCGVIKILGNLLFKPDELMKIRRKMKEKYFEMHIWFVGF